MTPCFRLALLVLLTAVPVAVAGCVSAERAYRGGMEAEVEGDYDAAARGYVTALRRDARLPNVRGRLVVASREAIRAHLATSAASSDPVARAEAWLAADAVATDAASVGVTAERPATFDADRDAALDAAVYTLLAQAAGRVDTRDYPGALAALDRARRYRPAPARQAELDATARTAHTYWAEDDLAAGRFRAALAHADAALGLTPPHADDAEALDALRLAILDAGTRRVALLPVDADGRAVPDRWLRDLDDLLDEGLATAGTPFLVYADPADVRRALRERGPSRMAGAGAAGVAERVGADLAVLVRLDAPAEAMRTTDRRRIGARRRAGRDTTSYVRTTTELRIETGAEISVVDVATRRPVCSETVRERASESFRAGVYAGDWRQLDLGRSERDLFDADLTGRARGRAFLTLRDRLAERIAERAVACLGPQIP